MAYRRRNSTPRSSTFEDLRPFPSDDDPSSPSSLAARAIRASAAHRDSSLSSAYDGDPAAASFRPPPSDRPQHDSNVYEYTSFKSLEGPKYGFWEVLAKKAKAILEDDNAAQQFEDRARNHSHMDNSMGGQFQSKWSSESSWKTENPTFQKDAIASSLREFGGTIKNAFEEGLSIVENKTADIIHETKKLQIRRKIGNSDTANQPMDTFAPANQSQNQTDYETQYFKNSRNVANAMAAKAKLLLRELKTVKADLAFAKQRCTQLEEENKVLRDSRQKGENPADDELIRHQLETLLEEKTRLAHENSVFARENRFLREIVEYHQLTMQDVVYLDEGIEEVTEVYPVHQISTHSSPSRSVHELSSSVLSTTPPTPRSSAMLSLSPMDSRAAPRSRNSPARNITEMEPAARTAEASIHQPSPSPTRP